MGQGQRIPARPVGRKVGRMTAPTRTDRLSIRNLPKGKRRWLQRVLKTLVRAEDWRLSAVYVAIGLVFASNRRGEATEQAIMEWIDAHRGDLLRLGAELAAEVLPARALARADAAKEATTETDFWHCAQEAAVIANRHFQRQRHLRNFDNFPDLIN